MTLLDIGGGLGGIQHALLDCGAVQATHVDASSAYLRAAQEEANQRSLGGNIYFQLGGFCRYRGAYPTSRHCHPGQGGVLL